MKFTEEFTEKLKLALGYLCEYYDILYDQKGYDQKGDGLEQLDELIDYFLAQTAERDINDL